jgi:predicted amidophosphoribosyltransferase
VRVHILEFGSLLSYTPRGASDKIRTARDVTLAIKTDHVLDEPPILPSEWIARTVKQSIPSLPFASFLTSKPILVPVPSSSLMKEDTLWVPDRIAKSLVANGIGREVVACLSRAVAVPKSATSDAPDRPKPLRHFDTLAIQERISQPPEEILLVDDIVTRAPRCGVQQTD